MRVEELRIEELGKSGSQKVRKLGSWGVEESIGSGQWSLVSSQGAVVICVKLVFYHYGTTGEIVDGSVLFVEVDGDK